MAAMAMADVTLCRKAHLDGLARCCAGLGREAAGAHRLLDAEEEPLLEVGYHRLQAVHVRNFKLPNPAPTAWGSHQAAQRAEPMSVTPMTHSAHVDTTNATGARTRANSSRMQVQPGSQNIRLQHACGTGARGGPPVRARAFALLGATVYSKSIGNGNHSTCSPPRHTSHGTERQRKGSAHAGDGGAVAGQPLLRGVKGVAQEGGLAKDGGRDNGGDALREVHHVDLPPLQEEHRVRVLTLAAHDRPPARRHRPHLARQSLHDSSATRCRRHA